MTEGNPLIYYVYVHRRATDNKVFYVGKGGARKNRAWESSDRNRHWHFVVAKHGFIVEIIKEKMIESDAFALEIELIAQYGRDNLVNMTDGGEGQSGRIASAETSRKISAALKGKKRSIASIEKQKATLTGRPQSALQIENRAAKLRGRPLSASHAEIARNAAKRFPCTCLETGEVFTSQHAAARWLKSIGFEKAGASGTSKSCKTGLTYHGYNFRHVEGG